MAEVKPNPPGDIPFTGLRDLIAFDNVTFEYAARGGETALSHASFVIRQGRSTALIGSSGAGKSTVVGLLCRLLQPTQGVITVDGNPLARIDISDWLNSIAIAGQDIDLIDGTIAENVSYNRPDIGREKIYEALSQAEADFVEELQQGLDTLVGSRGLSLSGGQRQRIGIARAFARNASIFILDEATNAIDSEAEALILATLHKFPGEKNIIVVSHRGHSGGVPGCNRLPSRSSRDSRLYRLGLRVWRPRKHPPTSCLQVNPAASQKPEPSNGRRVRVTELISPAKHSPR